MNGLVQIARPDVQPIRVFPRRTKWTPDDRLAFVGPPPLPEFRPADPETPVYVSATFTWDKRRAEHLAEDWCQYYRHVLVGGPAYDDPGGEFTPGMFLKAGCTITSRGCPKSCGWCKVPFAEGPLRELGIKSGWIVQDNNLLACSEVHLRAVFAMLRLQNRRIYFNGGLDKHFLKPWHRELFDSIRIGELWFACDTTADLGNLERAAALLQGIPKRKLRCYTMIGYDGESVEDAERRLQSVLDIGFMPFCQLYQPPCDPMPTKVYGADWKAVMKKWARPAAYMGSAAPPESPYFTLEEETCPRQMPISADF